MAPAGTCQDNHHANRGYTLVTIEDVQRMGTFFKELIESSHLKKWIILAGVGGICEGLRIAWDVAKFLLAR